MVLDAIETPRVFETVCAGTIVPVSVKRLSLAQLKQRSLNCVERLKRERRLEFMAAAELVPEKARNRFLIEAAKANTVSSEDLSAESESVRCLCDTLGMATPLSLEQLQQGFDADPDTYLQMYLYSLGVDIDAKTATPAGDEAPKDGTGFQAD